MHGRVRYFPLRTVGDSIETPPKILPQTLIANVLVDFLPSFEENIHEKDSYQIKRTTP